MIKVYAYHDGCSSESIFNDMVDVIHAAYFDDGYHKIKNRKLGFTKLVIVIKGDEENENK